MSDGTHIEWTATKHPDGTVTKGATWNIITGCSVGGRQHRHPGHACGCAREQR